MFAHHGSRNYQVDCDGFFTFHYECVGSFVYYHRSVIEEVGYMDENFHNAWEHVVHSLMIARSRGGEFMPNGGWRRWPDICYSRNFISEISVNSTHGVVSEHELMSETRVQEGLRYWEKNYHFPEDVRPLIREKRE